ncbi:MAG: hypothetical protein JW772_01060 [Candidatus Diapherotrites archaeon]|nr:hypothetical protein [Candidatus Diapherotrites archaeon]
MSPKKKDLPSLLRERRRFSFGIGRTRKPMEPEPVRWNVKNIGAVVAGRLSDPKLQSLEQTNPKWVKAKDDPKESKRAARERFIGKLRAMLGARKSDRIDFWKYKTTHYIHVYPTLRSGENGIELHKNLGVVIRIENPEIIEALNHLM